MYSLVVYYSIPNYIVSKKNEVEVTIINKHATKSKETSSKMTGDEKLSSTKK